MRKISYAPFKALMLVLFFHLIFHVTVRSQWVKTSGPPGTNVNTFFDNGLYLFAGTSSKGVFRSATNGASWMAVNNGLQNATVFSFLQDATYLYAGTDKGVYRSSDDGVNWSSANNGIETQFVYAMVTGGGYLFAGTSSGVYRSADKGNTWANANGGALDFSIIYAMCYVNNVLIVEADNYLFKSQNAGDTWFVDQGSTAFYVIKHFLVLGDTVIASARNGIFRSKNGGKTFTTFQPVEVDEYADLLGFSFSNGIIYTADKNGMFRSADYGVTWNAIPAKGLRFGTRFYNYFVQSAGNFFISMSELGVFGTADSGRTWRQAIKGFEPASTIDNSLLSLGRDTIIAGTHSDGIYGSLNNGDAWKKIGIRTNKDTLSNAIISALLRPAPNIILAGTGGDGLYRSADNGRTWSHITEGLPYKEAGNYEGDNTLAMSGSTVLIGTTNGIYFSTNNGLTWNPSNLNGDRISGFAIAANGNVAVAGVFEGVFPFQSGIYRSTNNGITWSLVISLFDDIISLASDGVDHFYGGGFFGNWRSVNNGLSWSLMSNGIPSNTGGFSVKVVNTNNVFIGNNLGIFFSNDQGNSFSTVNTGLDPAPNNSVQGLEANSTYLFAGLFNDAVWKRPLSDFGISLNSNSGLAVNEEKAIELNSKNNILVYPNPTTDKINIQYKANAAGEIRLVIMNTAGKPVAQSNQMLPLAGNYYKTIDVKQFTPGIYFVQIIANGKTNVAKFVVSR